MTVILKVTAPNRSIGTDKTWYLSPSTEVPVDDSKAGGSGNPTIPVINSVGRIEGAISRTILHEAQGISSSTQGEVSVTLQNDPAGTEGPLDEWDDYVLDDAVVKLYIDGSVAWTGAHRGEPLFSRTTNGGGTVTSVLAKPSGPDIQLMRLAGVPNAVRRLTQSVLKAAGAPSNVAYDVSEFTVFCHYTGELAGRVLNRVNSGSGSPQILISRISGDRLEIRGNDTSNVTQLLHQQDMPTGRPFHRVSVSISSSAAIVVVDGVATTYSGYAANTGAGGEMRLGGLETTYATDFTTWGWAFLDRAMTESEMKSATLSSLEDEPALVSLWRGDDGAGSTIVDSGPLGNDATISGVENTDWEWAPADSGELEQEGDLVPKFWGHGRQLPTIEIDSIRSRRLVASNNPDMTQRTVREGGEAISPESVDTDIGIIDLSGTPSKPVTLDTDAPFEWTVDVLQAFLDDVWPVTRVESDLAEAASQVSGSGGVWVDSESPVADTLTESLQGLGAWWDQTKDGNLTFGMLQRPVLKPPTRNSWLQARVAADTLVTQNGGTFTGWFYIHGASTNRVLFRLRPEGAQRIEVEVHNAQSLGYTIETMDVSFSYSAQKIMRSVAPRNQWCFFAVRWVSDGATGTDLTFDVGPVGGSLTQDTVNSAQSSTADIQPELHCGRNVHASDVAVFSSVLSDAEVDALFAGTTLPEDRGDVIWHTPLDNATESGGNWTTSLLTGSGQVDLLQPVVQPTVPDQGITEPVVQPEATWNLRLMAGAQMDVERIPVNSSVVLSYDRVRQRLSETDLSGTIPDADRANALLEVRQQTADNDLDQGADERVLQVDSIISPSPQLTLTNPSSVAKLLARSIADVFVRNTYLARIRGLPRDVINLSPHAETRVTDADGQDWVIRVLSRATNNVLDADTSGEILGLARKD